MTQAPRGQRLGMSRLTGVGIVGALVGLLFCGTMFTPLLAAALVVVGLGAVALHLEGVVMAAIAAFVVLALVAAWRQGGRRRFPVSHLSAGSAPTPPSGSVN